VKNGPQVALKRVPVLACHEDGRGGGRPGADFRKARLGVDFLQSGFLHERGDQWVIFDCQLGQPCPNWGKIRGDLGAGPPFTGGTGGGELEVLGDVPFCDPAGRADVSAPKLF